MLLVVFRGLAVGGTRSDGNAVVPGVEETHCVTDLRFWGGGGETKGAELKRGFAMELRDNEG